MQNYKNLLLDKFDVDLFWSLLVLFLKFILLKLDKATFLSLE